MSKTETLFIQMEKGTSFPTMQSSVKLRNMLDISYFTIIDVILLFGIGPPQDDSASQVSSVRCSSPNVLTTV